MTFAIVGAVAVMLVASGAVATEDAFAEKRRRKNTTKRLSQANACGNGKLPLMYSVQIVLHRFKAMRTQSVLHLIKQAVKTKTGYR